MTTATYTQRAFAWGTDDNSNPNSNTLGSEGADVTGVVKNVKTILHIQVYENNVGAGGSKNWQLYYNTTDNPATAAQVLTAGSGGTIVVMADGQPTHGANITSRRLSDPSLTFQTGEYTDGDATDKLALLQNQVTEFQFCILADSGAGDETDYFFYVRFNNGSLATHTDVPKLTTEAVVGTQEITPTFIDSTASVWTHAITTTVDVTPSIVPSVAQVFSPAVALAAEQAVVPVRIESAVSVGTHAVTSTVDVAPVRIESTVVIPTHAVTVGAADVAPVRIESTVLFPTAAVSAGIDEIESIGSGKDYSDIVSWEVAHSDPISDNKNYIGEIYDTADYNEALVIDNCFDKTDATRHRTLRAATGNEYDPADDTGVWVYSASGSADVFNLAEQYFRLERIGIYYSGTGFQNCVRTVEDEIRIDSCYGFQDLCTSSNRIFMADTSGDTTYWINCIAVGSDGAASLGAAYGFRSDATSTDMNCYNCLTFNVARGSGAERLDSGFKQVEGSETGDIQNCCAFDELTGTSQGEFFVSTSGNEDHNAATDDTASGTGSLDNQTQADFFTDGDAGDFSLKSGSNGIGAGIDLSGLSLFTLDFYGNEHGVGPGGWDMGPIAQPAGAGTQNLVPTIIPSAATVPIHAVTTGVVDLVPTRVESTVAIPVHAISTTVDVAPSRIGSVVSIPTHSLAVGEVTLEASRIESAATVGAHSVGQAITAVRIESAATVPTHSITLDIAAQVIPSRVSIPTPVVVGAGTPQGITTPVIPSAVTIPTHTISTGVVDLVPSRVESTASVPVHAVAVGDLDLVPTRVESTVSIPVHAITTGVVNVTTVRIESTVSIPTHSFIVGEVTLLASRIESEATVPTPVISVGAANVTPTVLPSQVSIPIHAAAVEGGPQDTIPSRIESSAQVFTAAITTGTVNVVPTRIESEATIPVHSLGTVIAPSRIESVASVGTHAVSVGAANLAASIIPSSAEVFQAAVTTGVVGLTPSRIESVVTLPTHDVGATYDLAPDRIESTVSIAIHSVTVGPANLTATIVVSRAQVFAHTTFTETLVREVVLLTSTISMTAALTSQISTTASLESDLSLEET